MPAQPCSSTTRFVEPVAPVRALTPDTSSSPTSGKPEALEDDDLTVESLSPCSGCTGNGDASRLQDQSSSILPDETGVGRGKEGGGFHDYQRATKSSKFAFSAPSLPASNVQQHFNSTSLAKLDVLDVSASAESASSPSGQCKQVVTRFAPAPKGTRCITISSSRQVVPPVAGTVSGLRPERWSLGGPAELFAGTKSTWDIVLGRNAASSPAAPAPPSIRTVSLSLADQRSRRASCPDQHHQDGVVYSTDRVRCSEPVLPDRLVRFVYPEPEQLRERRDAVVQVSGPPPLQLFVLPQHWGRGPGPCAWLVQAVFCQAGLATIILVLALLGAAAFHATEGPHEEQQFRELAKQQGELVVNLATELRQVIPQDAAWPATIARSVERHEALVLRAAAAGYGEGGAGESGARIWTFPGGLLFAASLLTTLGFGAPVPRTPLGRLAAVVLAVVGIPLNVILALQLGRLLCTRLPRALPLLLPRPPTPSKPNSHSPRICAGRCASCLPRCASGVHWTPLLVPVGSLLLYYLLGMVLFSSVLSLPASEWLLFPLSLTAAGGVAQVPGWVRVLYAAYLEGGILFAAVAVALLQAPATTATTDLAMRFGILDLEEYYGA